MIVLCFIVVSISAPAETPLEQDTVSLIQSIDHRNEIMKKYPNHDHGYHERFFLSRVLRFDFKQRNGLKDGLATDQTNKVQRQIDLDFYNDECRRGSKLSCKNFSENFLSYKNEYGSAYIPQKPIYPKVDYINYTYTMPDGRTYDLKKKIFLDKIEKQNDQKTEQKDASKQEISELSKVKSESNISEEEPVVIYDNESQSLTSEQDKVAILNDNTSKSFYCEWAPGEKRYELTGKGCSTKICSAYVNCTKDGVKSRRLATCSSDLCVEGKATECRKQLLGYGSVAVNFGSSKSKTNNNPGNSKTNK